MRFRLRPVQTLVVAAVMAALLLAHADAKPAKDTKAKHPGVMQDQSAKNGGAMRPCYDCHKEVKKQFASKKFVHPPVAKTQCESCHLRHGFSQKLVLVKPVPELCFGCHDAVKTAAKPEHVHAAFASGECLGCHDPHASDVAHLERDGGPETSCFVCHKATAAEAKKPHVHDVFAKGDCYACHDAHGSKNAGLLRVAGNELCEGCHKPAEVAAKHTKVATGTLACVDCHEPHASTAEHLQREQAHAPMAAGNCDACHQLEGGKPVAKLTAEVPGLCTGCHSDLGDLAKKSHPHPPAADGDCLQCHNPHRGVAKGLRWLDRR